MKNINRTWYSWWEVRVVTIICVEVQNLEVNWVPLSERISFGNPWSLKIWVINALAVCSEEGTLGNRMKIPIFVNLSRTTKIQVYPLVEGRPVMKSMGSEVQGRSGISSGSEINKVCVYNPLNNRFHKI